MIIIKYKDLKTPQDLYFFMKENIKYGFVNQNGTIIPRKGTPEVYYMEELFRNYYFQSPKELLMNKCGICYDQNELMKEWLLEHNYEVKTYYSPIRNHSIIVYKKDNKYYWIERTFKDAIGIHDFSNLLDLFEFYLFTQDSEYKNTVLYEYNINNYGCNFYEYICKAKEGKIVLKK